MCVELSAIGSLRGIRDSKQGGKGAVLLTSPSALAKLVADIKQNAYDLPA